MANKMVELLEQAEKHGYILPDQQTALDEYRAEQSTKEAVVANITSKAKGLAEDMGLDLDSITGTGKEGRITIKDVKLAAENATTPEQEAVEEVDDSPQATMKELLEARRDKGLTRLNAITPRWFERVDTAQLSYGKGVAEQVYGSQKDARAKLKIDSKGMEAHGLLVTKTEFKGESHGTALNVSRGLWIETVKELKASRKASKATGTSPADRAKAAAEAARKGETPPKVTRPEPDPVEKVDTGGREMATGKDALEIRGIKSHGQLQRDLKEGKVEGLQIEGKWFYYVDSLKARRASVGKANTENAQPGASKPRAPRKATEQEHMAQAQKNSDAIQGTNDEKVDELEAQLAELREQITRKNQSTILRPFRALGRKVRAFKSA